MKNNINKLAVFKGIPIISVPILERWKDITDVDIKAVQKYMRSKPISIISGGVLEEFENKFAEFIGTKYAVAFCNGTAALHAASFACGAERNANFIAPVYSYQGIINSILENNSDVYLCDIDPITLNLSSTAAKMAINSNTKGVVVQHCWGNPANMDDFSLLKKQYNISIISDASHAYGAYWNNNKIGSLDIEDIACFSLGKNKFISGGELGVASTNNKILRDALLFLGHTNRVPSDYISNTFNHFNNSLGNKFRPHTLSMVIALSQLEKLNEKINNNIEINQIISLEINKIPGFSTVNNYDNAKRVYWKLLVKIQPEYWTGVNVNNIIKALMHEGLIIEDFHNYSLEYISNIWSHERYRGRVHCKSKIQAEKVIPYIITLPGYCRIKKHEILSIINVFKKVSENKESLIQFSSKI